MLKISSIILAALFLSAANAEAGQSESAMLRKTKKPAPKTMTLPEAIELVQPSVVQILVRVQPPRTQVGGSQTAPLGTGFFANEDGYIVTALHVVRAFRNIAAGEGSSKSLMVGVAAPQLENLSTGVVKGLTIRSSFGLTECDVVDEDAGHDLALLKLKQNPFKGEMGTFLRAGDKVIDYLHRAPSFSLARPQDGEAIAVSGYPLRSRVLVTTSGHLASSWEYEIEEVHVPGAPEWFTRIDIADFYLADMHANPGNSGGPVYSVKHGQVIGVCVSFQPAPVVGNPSLSYNSGLSNVVPIRYSVDLLKKHSLRWIEAGS